MVQYHGDLHQEMRERNWDMLSGSLMETHMTAVPVATGEYSATLMTMEDSGPEPRICLLMGEECMLM